MLSIAQARLQGKMDLHIDGMAAIWYINNMKNIRNIGVFAHVDAGKTTLTERILQHCGAIRTVGSVDQGTAHTDRMDIERRRGISVYSTCAPVNWKGTRINIIDTPGHMDFSAEVERSMWALDCAVMVVSAAEGIQPQTEALFNALKDRPMVMFINKTDREGADVDAVMSAAYETLRPVFVDVSDNEKMMEFAAERDEAAMEAFFEGEVYPEEKLRAMIAEMCVKCEAIPVVAGSALRDIGVEALLDAVVEYLPSPEMNTDGPLSAVVFHIENDRSMGRAAFVRMFSGSLHTRDGIGERKITQIRDISLEGKAGDTGSISAGEIGVLYGLGDIKAGDVLGDAALIPGGINPGSLRQPLLLVKVEPEDPEKLDALRKALNDMSAEDPILSVDEFQRVPHVRVMGAIQLEILGDTLENRFGIKTVFGPPNVIYRETIAQSAEGFYAYVAPKPCWAVIKFTIEPLPRGSGVVFDSVVPVKDILPRYQHQVEQAIPLATKQGMLGWQVDDVKITLIDGNHHQFHTHPLDFIVATPIAFLDGMRRGGSTLLEPILDMRITVPEECAGRVMGEIIAMRGETRDSRPVRGMIRMECDVPVATSVDFSQRLAALTGGRGAMSTSLKGYRDCPLELGKTCERRGVDPLDTSKYILAARSALEGGIFDL